MIASRRLILSVAAALLLTACGSTSTSSGAEYASAEHDAALEEFAELEALEAAEALADEEYQSAYDRGYEEGLEAGIYAGGEDGREEGYSHAEDGLERDRYPSGHWSEFDLEYSPSEDSDGYLEGYEEGYSIAYARGYEVGYEAGYDEALAYYRDYNVENPYDLDCDAYGGPLVVSEDDPNNLDYDGDGIGCD